MPFKTEAMEEPHINLTPLVDVVFNLLLFPNAGNTVRRG